METPALTLGDVTFADFEIPETLAIGGDQMLSSHKLPGGTRVVDAMGPDERDIEWSGRFRGGNATVRAKRLDTLRSQGQQLTLTFGDFRRQVVISKFHYDVQMAGLEIPYRLTLLVVSNDDQPILVTPPSFDEALAADMMAMQDEAQALADVTTENAIANSVMIQLSETIQGYLLAAGNAQLAVITAMNTVANAYAAYNAVRAGNYAAIGSLVGAAAGAADTLIGPSNTLMASLLGASGTIKTAITLTAPVIAASALPASGAVALAAGSGVIAATAGFSQMASLMTLQSLTSRAAVNLGNQIGGTSWNGPAVVAAA